LKPKDHSVADLVNNVCHRIWPGTKYLPTLEGFLQLHFDGDDNEYWDFGVWSLDAYFNDLTTIPTVHMRKSVDRKLGKKIKAPSLLSEDTIMDSTMPSSQAYSMRASVADLGPETIHTGVMMSNKVQ
jgi:hypothetical protein